MDAPTILKLYSQPDGMGFVTHAGFLSDTDAERFAEVWNLRGGSISWVKCGHVL